MLHNLSSTFSKSLSNFLLKSSSSPSSRFISRSFPTWILENFCSDIFRLICESNNCGKNPSKKSIFHASNLTYTSWVLDDHPVTNFAKFCCNFVECFAHQHATLHRWKKFQNILDNFIIIENLVCNRIKSVSWRRWKLDFIH